ncbi:MAG: methylenetetrahydrofolate--tRNA-(uracil(54)-C(5))-methyltransferase (FADH(2)-oxidizing) TrmFO [Christensenellales bacterium]|jgi:methylenetetrahydrofolate--tRNA-(uracil-5-)-methyltransferase
MTRKTDAVVQVIGAGLAGTEAAWQLAQRGVPVRLHEMRPIRLTPAHHSGYMGELVCSNSLRSDRLENAVGLLKEEMRRLDSVVIAAADAHRVPAGGALAVDREGYARALTERVAAHPLIEVVYGEATRIPRDQPAIVAAGPLCQGALAEDIARLVDQDSLYFFDAAAPIVTLESLDMDKVFRQGRYGRGDDYLNCPMDREQYTAFYQALISAETAPVHGFEGTVFEGCMPVEEMAKRGERTLLFGPLKPKGLTDPRTGRRPFAVVQLRQDDQAGRLYNLVGFQTRLKWPEQRRVFGMIPGLERAEFSRYGVMHRNTFLRSPGKLDRHYGLIGHEQLHFAGQITGVEGYVESAASGMTAGIALAHKILGQQPPAFPETTALFALGNHVANSPSKDFQPMNIIYGIIPPLPTRIRGKQERNRALALRALADLDAAIAAGRIG